MFKEIGLLSKQSREVITLVLYNTVSVMKAKQVAVIGGSSYTVNCGSLVVIDIML